MELPTGDVVTYTWAPVNKAAEERIVLRDAGDDPVLAETLYTPDGVRYS